jgi:hypothetical protein
MGERGDSIARADQRRNVLRIAAWRLDQEDADTPGVAGAGYGETSTTGYRLIELRQL